VRDSGLVHALLNIGDMDALLSHMVVGASWEGYCIETLLACAPQGTQGYFYRSSAGAEVDLILVLPSGTRYAIEIKRSLSPKLARGFHSACDDLKPTQQWAIYPGKDVIPLSAEAWALPLGEAVERLRVI
jgi:uncharacterized protein